jgi:hypothetical protein
MSTQDPRPSTTGLEASGRGRRRGIIAAAAAVLAAVLVAVVIGLSGGNDDGSAPAAASSSPAPSTGAGATASDSAATTAPPESEDAADEDREEPAPDAAEPVSAEGEQLPPVLPEVPLDAEASPDDGVVLTVPRIEAIQGAAEGPGNVAGPAVRVTIRIENETGDPLSLDGVAVNMFHGEENTPASPLEDRTRQPFVGDLPDGEAAEGVYVFSVPADARDLVSVELGYRAGAPRAVFSGPVR